MSIILQKPCTVRLGKINAYHFQAKSATLLENPNGFKIFDTFQKSDIPLKMQHCRAFSGGRAGTRPNIRLGAIDRAPGNTIFPLKSAMSHSGVHTGKFCRQK